MAARQVYFAALDGGNTAAMVNLVKNNTITAPVLNTLTSCSPWVSERVFRTLISKYPIIPVATIRSLLVQNPDVLGDGVFWVYLNNCGIFGATDIQVLQIAKGNTTVRTPIQQNMAAHRAEMAYWGTLYLNDYLRETPNYSSTLYQGFLQSFFDYQSDALTVEEMLRNGNLIQALNKLDNMETSYCITPEEVAQHAQYRQVVQTMVNAFLDGRSIYEINLSELGQIQAISQNASGLPKILAKNIIQVTVGTIPAFAPCTLPSALAQFKGGTSDRADNNFPKTLSTITSELLCFPNPAGDFVQFDLSRIPVDLRCGQLTILDMMGKVVTQRLLDDSSENIIFDTRNVATGVYLYRLSCSQNKTLSGKFVVKKP